MSALSLWAGLSRIGRGAAQIVLPSWCIVCASPLPWRDRRGSCCAKCWSDLPRLRGHCSRCSLPMELAKETPMLCLDCSSSPSELDWIASWGEYRSGIERLLHAFKFERHDFLGEPLGELLSEAFRTRNDDDFDCVVAVPMHPKKMRRRGYNQAELLARSLARRVRLPLRRDLLRKVRESSMQSTLPRGERAENVRRAFTAGPHAKGLAVVLVDDICTTGETLRACARELVRQGARRVCAVTLARA